MIKKLTLIFALATLAAGCSKPAANTSNKDNISGTSNSNIRSADGKIDKGDRVIVPSSVSKSMFLEGEVMVLDGSRASVSVLKRNPSGVHTPSGQMEHADVSELYEVPDKDAQGVFKVGDIVIARGQLSDLRPWYGAEVVEIKSYGTVVKGLGENKEPWVPDAIIKPSEKSINELKGAGESSMLLGRAMKHRPILVEGYKPKAGDKVLAEPHLAGFFSSGVISKTMKSMGGEDIVFVKWDDPKETSNERLYTILPLASAAKQSVPAVGRYLLVKPLSGANWEYAEVTAVNGESVEVKVADGTSRTVKPGEFWLLEESQR